MFVKLFPNILNNKLVKLFNRFINSKFYISLIGLMLALSAIFGFEIPIFYITVVIAAVLPALFCIDMTSVLPPALMFYCSFSLKHSDPVSGVSFFDNSSYKVNLIICASIAAFFMLVRLIFDLIKKDGKFGFPRLTIGFVLFFVVSCISGISSETFSFNSVLAGSFISFSLLVAYFYFFYSIKWSNEKIDYVFFSLIVFGLALCAQIVATYFITENIEHLIGREKVTIGWGIHTNIGGAICILTTVPFYYICKGKHLVLNTFVAILFLMATIASQARGPIVVALGMVFVALIISLFKIKQRERIKYLFILFAVFSIGFGMARIIFTYKLDKFLGLINSITGFDSLREFSNLRIGLYEIGLQQFVEKPFIGNGWLSCVGPAYTKVFLPPRWHNTFVQTLATGGVALTLTYLFHRIETIILLFRKNKRIYLNKLFLFLSVLGLLFSSLVDCFIFNMGPSVVYGILLVAIEKCDNDTMVLFSKKRVK